MITCVLEYGLTGRGRQNSKLGAECGIYRTYQPPMKLSCFRMVEAHLQVAGSPTAEAAGSEGLCEPSPVSSPRPAARNTTGSGKSVDVVSRQNLLRKRGAGRRDRWLT